MSTFKGDEREKERKEKVFGAVLKENNIAFTLKLRKRTGEAIFCEVPC